MMKTLFLKPLKKETEKSEEKIREAAEESEEHSEKDGRKTLKTVLDELPGIKTKTKKKEEKATLPETVKVSKIKLIKVRKLHSNPHLWTS
jgi:hypothetical protein